MANNLGKQVSQGQGGVDLSEELDNSIEQNDPELDDVFRQVNKAISGTSGSLAVDFNKQIFSDQNKEKIKKEITDELEKILALGVKAMPADLNRADELVEKMKGLDQATPKRSSDNLSSEPEEDLNQVAPEEEQKFPESETPKTPNQTDNQESPKADQEIPETAKPQEQDLTKPADEEATSQPTDQETEQPTDLPVESPNEPVEQPEQEAPPTDKKPEEPEQEKKSDKSENDSDKPDQNNQPPKPSNDSEGTNQENNFASALSSLKSEDKKKSEWTEKAEQLHREVEDIRKTIRTFKKLKDLWMAIKTGQLVLSETVVPAITYWLSLNAQFVLGGFEIAPGKPIFTGIGRHLGFLPKKWEALLTPLNVIELYLLLIVYADLLLNFMIYIIIIWFLDLAWYQQIQLVT